MNRRQAIGSIVIGTAAVTFFPQCQSVVLPTFKNFTIEKKRYLLLEHLSHIILPLDELKVNRPEPTPEYILNIIDACYDQKDIQKFIDGWTQYQTYLKENVSTSYQKWDAVQTATVLQHLEALDKELSPLGFFYQESKNLTRQHFLTSPYYMTQHLEYQLIPGGYEGCVAV